MRNFIKFHTIQSPGTDNAYEVTKYFNRNLIQVVFREVIKGREYTRVYLGPSSLAEHVIYIDEPLISVLTRLGEIDPPEEKTETETKPPKTPDAVAPAGG